ncbi:MAG: DMT family transporter [Geminicoccaceae bacterium]
MAAASTSEDSAPVPRLALILIGAISILWGLNWPAMKFVVGELDPWTFRVFSVFGAGFTLLLIARISGEPMAVPRQLWGRFAIITLFAITGWHMLTAYGLGFVGGGRAAIVAFTMPIWAMLLSVLFLDEKLDARRVLALASGMSGIFFLIGSDFYKLGASPVGTVLILAAAMCWGIGTVGIKAHDWRIGSIALSGWMLVMGGLPILAFWLAMVAPPDLSKLSWTGLSALAYVIFVALVFCFTSFLRIVTLLPASVAAISTLVIPVTGVISSSMLLGEEIGTGEITALVLVLFALALVLLRPRRPADKRQ